MVERKCDACGTDMSCPKCNPSSRADSAQEPKPMKLKIKGVEFDVSEQVAQAIEQERADAKTEIAALTTARDAAQAKVDAADKARADAEDPKRIEALVASRVALHGEARKHLGVDAKLDGLTDRAVRELVVEKLAGAKLDSKKSDDYVLSYFEAEVARAAKANPVVGVIVMDSKNSPDGEPDFHRKRAEIAARHANGRRQGAAAK